MDNNSLYSWFYPYALEICQNIRKILEYNFTFIPNWIRIHTILEVHLNSLFVSLFEWSIVKVPFEKEFVNFRHILPCVTIVSYGFMQFSRGINAYVVIQTFRVSIPQMVSIRSDKPSAVSYTHLR